MANHDYQVERCDPATADALATFHIGLTITVTDPEALWFAAFIKGVTGADTVPADITDVIGPAVDPSIIDCVAMLTAPQAIPGCRFDDFRIEDAICTARLDHALPPAWDHAGGGAGNGPLLRLAVSN